MLLRELLFNSFPPRDREWALGRNSELCDEAELRWAGA